VEAKDNGTLEGAITGEIAMEKVRPPRARPCLHYPWFSNPGFTNRKRPGLSHGGLVVHTRAHRERSAHQRTYTTLCLYVHCHSPPPPHTHTYTAHMPHVLQVAGCETLTCGEIHRQKVAYRYLFAD